MGIQMKRPYWFFGLVLGILLFTYSALGVFQALDLFSDPNDRERLIVNLRQWGATALVGFALAVFSSVRLWLWRKNAKRSEGN